MRGACGTGNEPHMGITHPTPDSQACVRGPTNRAPQKSAASETGSLPSFSLHALELDRFRLEAMHAFDVNLLCMQDLHIQLGNKPHMYTHTHTHTGTRVRMRTCAHPPGARIGMGWFVLWPCTVAPSSGPWSPCCSGFNNQRP